jgi:excisionase family DNA binding protein
VLAMENLKLNSQFFDNSKKLLSAKQVASYLNVSVPTIYRWVDKGMIDVERIGPKLIRFDKDKIDLWVASFNRKEPTDGNHKKENF